MNARALALAFLAAALTATAVPAAGSDENYTLDCKWELIAGTRTRPIPKPIVAEVSFSGRERQVRDPQDSGNVTFEDLTIRIGGETRRGGRFKGSTYDASTTYDGTFARNLHGTVEWAYSRSLNAFTLTRGNTSYVCKIGAPSEIPSDPASR